jgi:endonuclease/exonuclease/phosphatase family metal-dependent hydrolase
MKKTIVNEKLTKHLLAALCAAATALAAPSVRGEGASPEPMRMLTFNIYSDWHVKDGGVKPREVGMERTLLRIKPDIAALQEVSGHWWASPMFEHFSDTYGIVRGDMADALRRAGPPPPAKDGKEQPESASHTHLLYRKDRLALLDSGFDIFHVSLGTSKGVTWAVFEDKRSGRRFISFSTHFWFKHKLKEDDALRELNVRSILRRVTEIRRKWGDIPVIGGGDLNCNPGSHALETFRREGYANAMEVAAEKTARSATRTYHGRLTQDESGKYHGTVAPPGRDKPEQSIDHIFFRGGIRALRYDIDLDPETLDASDHSPVIVDFTF